MKSTHVINTVTVISLLLLFGCTSLSGKKIVDNGGTVTAVDVGGLPITVQRSKKAVFIVTKSTYSVTKSTFNDQTGTVTTEDAGKETQVAISEKPIFLGPTEVFTIDPKRPAAGTIDYAITLENGYPTSITGKIDDQTIAQVRQLITEAIEKISPLVGGIPTPQSGASFTRTLQEQTLKLVIFDLETGTIEMTDV